MFDEPGKKIQLLAKILFWIGIVSAIIGGITVIVIMGAAGIAIGLGTIIGGAILAYITNLILYGFGKLVESNERTLGCISGHYLTLTDDPEYKRFLEKLHERVN